MPRGSRRASKRVENQKQFQLNYRLRHADGHWVWVEELGQGVYDPDGTLRFLEGTVFDVTDRVLAEQRLRQETINWSSGWPSGPPNWLPACGSCGPKKRTIRKLLDLQDQERKLTAYEIHDGLLQYVVASELLISSDPEAETPGFVAKVLATAHTAINEGRRLISDLARS